MTFPLPMNAENVGVAIAATGLIGTPPMEFVFSAPLMFAASAAANTAIATLSNNGTSDTLSISPADDRVRWDGNVLEVGATATTSAQILYYTVTRARAGVSFSQTVTIAVV